jgi:hypothetical protein
VHAAPAVSVLCRQGGAWRWFRALLAALAGAAFVAWGLAHLQLALWPALAFALLAGGLAWWLAQPSPMRLAWDGQHWSADGRVGRLDLMMDLGPWMLLRLRPADAPGRCLWLPLGVGDVEADTGASLHALRAALYCRPPESTRRARPAERGDAAKPD